MSYVDLKRQIGLLEEWRLRAACRGIDTNLFFPDRGDDQTEPKGICMGCPVRPQCLGYAVRRGEKGGIWGGESERKRRALRKRMQAAQAAKAS